MDSDLDLDLDPYK